MAHYLVYWKPEAVASSHWPTLQYSASKQYSKLRPGDVLWVVTSEEPNDLVLVGRQLVNRIVERDEAMRILGSPDIWPADFYAISDNPEEKVNLDISHYAYELSFDGIVNQLPENFSGQHLQTLRRLDFDSELIMERLWQKRDDFDSSEQPDRPLGD